jgi:hypothetical protein
MDLITKLRFKYKTKIVLYFELLHIYYTYIINFENYFTNKKLLIKN